MAFRNSSRNSGHFHGQQFHESEDVAANHGTKEGMEGGPYSSVTTFKTIQPAIRPNVGQYVEPDIDKFHLNGDDNDYVATATRLKEIEDAKIQKSKSEANRAKQQALLDDNNESNIDTENEVEEKEIRPYVSTMSTFKSYGKPKISEIDSGDDCYPQVIAQHSSFDSRGTPYDGLDSDNANSSTQLDTSETLTNAYSDNSVFIDNTVVSAYDSAKPPLPVLRPKLPKPANVQQTWVTPVTTTQPVQSAGSDRIDQEYYVKVEDENHDKSQRQCQDVCSNTSGAKTRDTNVKTGDTYIKTGDAYVKTGVKTRVKTAEKHQQKSRNHSCSSATDPDILVVDDLCESERHAMLRRKSEPFSETSENLLNNTVSFGGHKHDDKFEESNDFLRHTVTDFRHLQLQEREREYTDSGSNSPCSSFGRPNSANSASSGNSANSVGGRRKLPKVPKNRNNIFTSGLFNRARKPERDSESMQTAAELTVPTKFTRALSEGASTGNDRVVDRLTEITLNANDNTEPSDPFVNHSKSREPFFSGNFDNKSCNSPRQIQRQMNVNAGSRRNKITNSGLLVANSGFKDTNSGLLVANSGFKDTNSGLLVANSGFKDTNSGLLGANSGFKDTNSGLLVANSGFKDTNSGLLVANSGFKDTSRIIKSDPLEDIGSIHLGETSNVNDAVNITVPNFIVNPANSVITGIGGVGGTANCDSQRNGLDAAITHTQKGVATGSNGNTHSNTAEENKAKDKASNLSENRVPMSQSVSNETPAISNQNVGKKNTPKPSVVYQNLIDYQNHLAAKESEFIETNQTVNSEVIAIPDDSESGTRVTNNVDVTDGKVKSVQDTSLNLALGGLLHGIANPVDNENELANETLQVPVSMLKETPTHANTGNTTSEVANIENIEPKETLPGKDSKTVARCNEAKSIDSPKSENVSAHTTPDETLPAHAIFNFDPSVIQELTDSVMVKMGSTGAFQISGEKTMETTGQFVVSTVTDPLGEEELDILNSIEAVIGNACDTNSDGSNEYVKHGAVAKNKAKTKTTNSDAKVSDVSDGDARVKSGKHSGGNLDNDKVLVEGKTCYGRVTGAVGDSNNNENGKEMEYYNAGEGDKENWDNSVKPKKASKVERSPSYRKRVMARAKSRYSKKSVMHKECSCARNEKGVLQKCQFCENYEMKKRSRSSLGLGMVDTNVIPVHDRTEITTDDMVSALGAPLSPRWALPTNGGLPPLPMNINAVNSPRTLRKVQVSSRVDVLLSTDLFRKHLNKHEHLLHKHMMFRRSGMRKSVSNLDLTEGFIIDNDSDSVHSGMSSDRNGYSPTVSHDPSPANLKLEQLRRNSLTGDSDSSIESFQRVVNKKKPFSTLPKSYGRTRPAIPNFGGEVSPTPTRQNSTSRSQRIPSFDEFKKQKDTTVSSKSQHSGSSVSVRQTRSGRSSPVNSQSKHYDTASSSRHKVRSKSESGPKQTYHPEPEPSYRHHRHRDRNSGRNYSSSRASSSESEHEVLVSKHDKDYRRSKHKEYPELDSSNESDTDTPIQLQVIEESRGSQEQLLTVGVDDAKNGANDMKNGVKHAENGVKHVKNGVKDVKNGVKDVKNVNDVKCLSRVKDNVKDNSSDVVDTKHDSSVNSRSNRPRKPNIPQKPNLGIPKINIEKADLADTAVRANQANHAMNNESSQENRMMKSKEQLVAKEDDIIAKEEHIVAKAANQARRTLPVTRVREANVVSSDANDYVKSRIRSLKGVQSQSGKDLAERETNERPMVRQTSAPSEKLKQRIRPKVKSRAVSRLEQEARQADAQTLSDTNERTSSSIREKRRTGSKRPRSLISKKSSMESLNQDSEGGEDGRSTPDTARSTDTKTESINPITKDKSSSIKDRPKLKVSYSINRSKSDTRYDNMQTSDQDNDIQKQRPVSLDSSQDQGAKTRSKDVIGNSTSKLRVSDKPGGISPTADKGKNSVSFYVDVVRGCSPFDIGESETSTSVCGSLSDSIRSEIIADDTSNTTDDSHKPLTDSDSFLNDPDIAREAEDVFKDDQGSPVLRSTSDVCKITQEAARKKRERKERPYKSDPFSGTEIIPASKRWALREERAKLRQRAKQSSSKEEVLTFLDDVKHGGGGELDTCDSFPSLEELNEDEEQMAASTEDSTKDDLRKICKHFSNVSSLSTDSGVIGQEGSHDSQESSPTNTLSHSHSDRSIPPTWHPGSRRSISASCSDLTKTEVDECLDCQPTPDVTLGQMTAAQYLVCPRCQHRRVQRKETILEIIDTEINYGRDLNLLKEEFYKPMLRSGLLNKEQLDAIFLNLDELIHVNKHCITKLKSSINSANENNDIDLQEVMIGCLFLESSTMFLTFENYCVNQAQSPLLLEQFEREKELLRIFLQASQNDNQQLRKLHLKAFLMVPVQRIMKYPLLLDRLYKTTPDHHVDKASLRVAKEKIEDILGCINAKSKTASLSQRKLSHRKVSCNVTEKMEVSRVALSTLHWNRKDVCDVITSQLHVSQPVDHTWATKKCKNYKFTSVYGVLMTLTQTPTDSEDLDNSTNDNLNTSNISNNTTLSNNDNNNSRVKSAAVVLIKEKNGRYQAMREPFMLEKCIVSQDPDFLEVFEILEWNKEAFLVKADSMQETNLWVQNLRQQMKNLGCWRKRRNALPNILLNHIQ